MSEVVESHARLSSLRLALELGNLVQMLPKAIRQLP